MPKLSIPVILAIVIVVAVAGLGVKGLFFSAQPNGNGNGNAGTGNGSFEPDPVLSGQLVDGVRVVSLGMSSSNYSPEVIRVKKGVPVRIVADLSSVQGCFRSFTIPQLGIRTYFTDKSDSVEFTPTEAGTFAFSCSMGMGRGVLVVV